MNYIRSIRAGILGAFGLGLALTSCAQAMPRGDAARAGMVEARLDASRAEAPAAALQNEIRLLRQELTTLNPHQAATQREQARLVERIDRLLELELRSRGPAEPDRPITHTLYRR